MAKDTRERNAEPNLNLKAYLANAYLHPIFQSFEEVEELVEVKVDKVRVDRHQINKASPPRSERNSPSPVHEVESTYQSTYHYEAEVQSQYEYHHESPYYNYQSQGHEMEAAPYDAYRYNAYH